jgi:hypothetical protein
LRSVSTAGKKQRPIEKREVEIPVERVTGAWKEREGEAAENGWSIKHRGGKKRSYNLSGKKKDTGNV